MEMHFATVWESLADAIGDEPALIHGDVRRSWREYDDRAARLAAVFGEAGFEPGTRVGLLMYNANEYLEAQYAAMKQRLVPINVNYRYLDDELVYLLENADCEGLVFHTSLAERVARVADRLPLLRLLIAVDDSDGSTAAVEGALDYEELIADHRPAQRITRAEDDIYMLYTGGTTGMPKGVIYAMGGTTASFVESSFPVLGLTPTTDAAQIAPMVKEMIERGEHPVSVPCAPLMHGTGVWIGAMMPHLGGAAVVTLTNRSLDPAELLGTVQRERATMITIVGDAFSKPLLVELERAAAEGAAYDLSSLKAVISSGVMWTVEVKERLLEWVPQAMLVDAAGSTEGTMGISIMMKGLPAATATFAKMPTTQVFTDDGRRVEAGSDEIGLIAAGGNVPLGYHKDPTKSAATFKVIDGVRYSFPGDMAKVAGDGSLILIGRGSNVINSGGEKIFPEEVEEAVKRVDGVVDCLVVGVEDDRFGQAVHAVVSREDGSGVDEPTIIAEVKTQLAGYKAPKRVVFVERVPRSPNGKGDYPAARAYAVGAAG
jgi:3-oxocholest-4-en-26-oate---CoA ligase